MKKKFSRETAMRVRNSFSEVKLHRFLPDGFVRKAEQLAYWHRMSAWQEENAAIERGYDGTETGEQLRARQFHRLLKGESLGGPLCYLEFGVAEGTSFRWWAGHNESPDSTFVGFDTFTGLPEDWGSIPEGTFSTGGRPPELQDDRCHFEKGLFQETLPSFLQEHDLSGRLVVHLDADLYGPTLFVLTMLWPYLKEGDVLILGDFCSIRHPTHVFRAFMDFLDAYPFSYVGLDSTRFGQQYALRVL